MNTRIRRKSTALTLALVFIFVSSAVAQISVTRNPLNIVPGGQFQVKYGALSVGPDSDVGPVLMDAHVGDWAEYKAFDFDSGVAEFRLETATSALTNIVEVHLDRPDGPLLGSVKLRKTYSQKDFSSVRCSVNSSEAGIRDIYLVFTGEEPTAAMNVRTFIFEKSVRAMGPPIDLSGRLDKADDGEKQATRAWGLPENGLTDDFGKGTMANWAGYGFTVVAGAAVAQGDASAYTPNAYINKTDIGGAWRTMAEASLTADITAEDRTAKPALGFTSVDNKQSVFVVLDFADDVMRAYRRLADGTVTLIRTHPKLASDPNRTFHLQPRKAYRLHVDWSPYSNGLIAFLFDPTDPGKQLASFRTAIDLPVARRPLLANSGGTVRFTHVVFNPRLDGWDYRWQWLKQPAVNLKDVCNPAVWKWTDGKYYLVWRKFGSDTYHGIATSDDAIHWTIVTSQVMKCTGDMNVLVDPFGDGKVYCTPGGSEMPWFTSDGSNRFTHWSLSGRKVGDLHGYNRIQEIIDTRKHPAMSPVEFKGTKYQFVAFVEDWSHEPKPHTAVMLSNTLSDWTLANADMPVLSPRADFWGEKGSAIGAATVLPDGNILLASCSCTNEGYTGAPEPSNISVIVNGKQPWKILKLGTLPNAPVSRENVWYQGPNFGTAFIYEPNNDTLYFYGGFHDYAIGMMRVQGFLHGNATGTIAP